MNVLMVTIGYPPAQVGGTEIYVAGLVEELRQRGHVCTVAYLDSFAEPGGPEVRVDTREHEGVQVRIVRANTARFALESMVFDAALRKVLLGAFNELADSARPDIVHFHPLQLGLDAYLIESFHDRGLRTVLTHHSSNTSCARGDLVYGGRRACDGELRRVRCTRCFLHWAGVPGFLAAAFALPPPGLYAAVGPLLPWKKARSAASLPLLIQERFRAWSRATGNADAVVAVGGWVKEVCERNGVPPEKLTLSRHGLRLRPAESAQAISGPCRFGYLGRISPEKGVGVLLDALERMPDSANFQFEFVSSTFASGSQRPEETRLVESIRRLARDDSRIRVAGAVPDEELSRRLAGWDAIVVPSLWFESGPQVVYEAFAVKTPVIGSRRGGIAELVQEGHSGLLCEPGDAPALTALLARVAAEPAQIRAMRRNIGPVRTTADVADDMLQIYSRLSER